jgi:hypothetical protein
MPMPSIVTASRPPDIFVIGPDGSYETNIVSHGSENLRPAVSSRSATSSRNQSPVSFCSEPVDSGYQTAALVDPLSQRIDSLSANFLNYSRINALSPANSETNLPALNTIHESKIIPLHIPFNTIN